MITAEQLLALDRAHVWHPYATKRDPDPYVVTSAAGNKLRLADGRELIDGMASWWSVVHGYRRPELDHAITNQLSRMAHVMFGGLTHEPAVRLAERLCDLTGMDQVFFADSGSVAVEVGMKMAVQASRGAVKGGHASFLALRGGYHGDTLGAMSVCDPDRSMHSMFGGAVPKQVFAKRPAAGFNRPVAESWSKALRELVAAHRHEVVGLIAEPVLQGAGGMHVYAPGYLRVMREVCDEFELILIFDEIATGFWRTGRRFASDHAGVRPDILLVGKALTGGHLSFGAALCTNRVAERITASGSALMHGPTFMANPLACAVSLASLDLLEQPGTAVRIGGIEAALAAGLAPARNLPGVVDVRVLGSVGVIEMERQVDISVATAAAVELGVWLRPFGRLIYAMPPYSLAVDETSLVAEAMVAAARAPAVGY